MSAPRYLLLLTRPSADHRGLVDKFASMTGLIAIEAPVGAILLCSDPKLALFVSPTDAIIGDLFDKKTATRLTTDELVATKLDFAALLSNYWGGYIAVRRGHTSDEVLRDPSGALPCYHVTTGMGLALASDAQTLCDAGLLTPEIDYSSLACHLYGAGLPTRYTVLRGLNEVPPGFCLSTGRGEVEELWSPWQFVSEAQVDNREPIEVQLRRTVQNCVTAWTDRRKKILIGVSGGLDSSIVASCLSRTGTSVVAATLTTSDSEGDERLFARPLADALDIELIEAEYRHEHIDITKSAAAHLPRPIARTQILAHDATMLAIAREHSIDAFFSGNGGDNVFCFLQSAKPLVDRLLTSGPGFGAFHVLKDICRMTGCSPFQALRLAARTLGSSGRGYRWKGDPTFLSGDALSIAIETVAHPWLVAPSNALPGKAAHIAMLLRAQLTLEGFDRRQGPITINPLISQPVMELCLSIPSWQWCADGRNRAVARRAFADILPERIIGRRHKGGPDGFSVEILERNRARIAERLLDGRMAQQGLLDRNALEEALRDRGPTFGVERVRILALLDTEAWLDHWSGMRSSTLGAPGDWRRHAASDPNG